MPVGAPQAPGQKAPKAGGAAKTLGSAGRTAAREEGLEGLGQIATAACIMTQNYADAGALDMHFAPLAHEIAVLAEDNEKVANIVDRITAIGPYAALLSAAMPLVIQILINHDRIKPEAAGMLGGKVMSKEALAAKVSADVDKKKAEYLKVAQEAQEEAARAQADLVKAAA
jgi:hypothetical protein